MRLHFSHFIVRLQFSHFIMQLDPVKLNDMQTPFLPSKIAKFCLSQKMRNVLKRMQKKNHFVEQSYRLKLLGLQNLSINFF